MSPDIGAWINTAKYTTSEIVFFSLGGFFWVVCYAAVLRGIRKHHVVEIPAAAVVANMAWETTWALIYKTDLGPLFVWGYRSWFVLDLFIFGYLFVSGAKHISNATLRNYFRPAVVVGYLSWLVMLYYFVRNGYDTPTGLMSGFIATALMSALYVLTELEAIDFSEFSAVAAWSKLLGNGFAAVFCFMALANLRSLLTLCVVTFILDVAYLRIYYRRRAKPLSH